MRLLLKILIISFFFLSENITASTASNGSSGLQLEWLNKNVSPNQDFYEFANGTWCKQHHIPPAYAGWGVIYVMREQNIQTIHQIILDISKKQNLMGSIEQKIVDFYQSGMNETDINKQGILPLQPELQRIQNINHYSDLQKEIAHLQLLGISAPFYFDQMQDYYDSSQVIGVANQAGLGLPDRDYYLKNDKKFKDIRHAYFQHMIRTFRLLGDSYDSAHNAAKTIMKMETAFAKASLSRIEQRNPHAIYHIMTLSELQTMTPNFDWQTYFNDLGYPDIKKN